MSEKIVEFLRTEKIPKNKKPSPPKKIYEELRDCTFHPKINRVYVLIYLRSNMIVNNRSMRKEEMENFKEVFGSKDCEE